MICRQIWAIAIFALIAVCALTVVRAARAEQLLVITCDDYTATITADALANNATIEIPAINYHPQSVSIKRVTQNQKIEEETTRPFDASSNEATYALDATRNIKLVPVTLKPFAVKAGSKCENTAPAYIAFDSAPSGRERGLSLCGMTYNSGNSASVPDLRVSGAASPTGYETVALSGSIVLNKVKWSPARADKTLATVDLAYWPREIDTRTIRERVANGSTQSDPVARAIMEDLCVSLPTGWNGKRVAQDFGGMLASALTLTSGYASAATVSGNLPATLSTQWLLMADGRFCPMVTPTVAAHKIFLDRVHADLSLAPQVRFTIQFSVASPAVNAAAALPGVTISEGYLIARARFAEGILVKDTARVLTYDVNLPLQKWASHVCLAAENATGMGQSARADASALSVRDEDNRILATFGSGDLQLVRKSQLVMGRNEDEDPSVEARLNARVWYCVPLEAGATNAAFVGNAQSSRRVAVWYDESRGPEADPKNWTALAGPNAFAQAHLVLGTSWALAKTETLPDSAFTVRAHVPFALVGLGMPSVFQLNLDVGGTLGARLSSEKGESITGASLGLYSSACFKFETKLTPRFCGAFVAEATGGQTVVTDSAGVTDVDFGGGAQVAAMLVVGAL